eukprot:COSAG01_NODE_698_length_14177_cov_13.550039_17_plen_56_part_00
MLECLCNYLNTYSRGLRLGFCSMGRHQLGFLRTRWFGGVLCGPRIAPFASTSGKT